MGREIIDLLVDGGKAVASPQIGQKLGPAGINISDVLKQINEKTALFAGMKVPIKLNVDTSTKEVEFIIGTPPVSELIKKELGVEKGSSAMNLDKIGNLAIEQVIKLAKMKKESMLVNTFKKAVKNIVGSCCSIGSLIEGKEPKVIEKEIDLGVYDALISAERTEISDEKKILLKQQLEMVREEIKKEQEKAKAKEEVKEETKEVGKEEVKEETKAKVKTAATAEIKKEKAGSKKP